MNDARTVARHGIGPTGRESTDPTALLVRRSAQNRLPGIPEWRPAHPAKLVLILEERDAA